MPSKAKTRRLLRFSIREALLVTALAAAVITLAIGYRQYPVKYDRIISRNGGWIADTDHLTLMGLPRRYSRKRQWVEYEQNGDGKIWCRKEFRQNGTLITSWDTDHDGFFDQEEWKSKTTVRRKILVPVPVISINDWLELGVPRQMLVFLAVYMEQRIRDAQLLNASKQIPYDVEQERLVLSKAKRAIAAVDAEDLDEYERLSVELSGMAAAVIPEAELRATRGEF